MAKSIANKSKGEKVLYAIIFCIFFIYACTLIYPFIWAFFNSLKTNREYFKSPIALPKEWLFSNYAGAFEELEMGGQGLLSMLFNSLWLTFGGTFLSVMVSSMSAYVVAKYEFPGKSFIYSVAIVVMLIPIVGSLPASYKLIHQLGMADNISILLLYTGGFGFNFLILYGFFKNLSWNYAEAGFVDGASDFKVYTRIMLPQAKPPLLSLGIIAAIGVWNDYMTPLLYLKSYPTIASGIFRFQELMKYKSNYPLYFCAIIMATLPILIVFAVFQKTIMENTVAGGLKG